MTNKELIACAEEAKHHAYVPYSHFRVGAALLCKDGSVYEGCNIENASFGATNCAERTAFFKAIFDGHRDFEAIAIVGNHTGSAEEFCWPCGICRQVMLEFCSYDFRLVFHNENGAIKEYTLKELFPLGFSQENLE